MYFDVELYYLFSWELNAIQSQSFWHFSHELVHFNMIEIVAKLKYMVFPCVVVYDSFTAYINKCTWSNKNQLNISKSLETKFYYFGVNCGSLQ